LQNKLRKGGVKNLLTLPNIATLFNLSLGFMAIIYSTVSIEIAYLLVIFATLTDSLDGFLARRLGQIPEIGKELDSLADIISFGIAPAVMLINCKSAFDIILIIVSIIYVSCGALRLARFNVYGTKEFFEGLAIPASAMLVSSSVITLPPNICAFLFVLASMLMISSIEYPSLKVKEGVKANLYSILIGFIIFIIYTNVVILLPFSSIIVLMGSLILSQLFSYGLVSPMLFKKIK